MESTEIYTDLIEREGREADARDRDADTTGEDDGDRFRNLLGFHFEAAPEAGYVSTERVIVHYPNGYDDADEEIEDEYEVDEETN